MFAKDKSHATIKTIVYSMYHRYILNLIKSQWIFDGTKRKKQGVPSAIYTLFKLHIFRKRMGQKPFNLV